MYTPRSMHIRALSARTCAVLVGMEARIKLNPTPRGTGGTVTDVQRALGATHLSVVTDDEGRDGSGHIWVRREHAETVDLSLPHATN